MVGLKQGLARCGLHQEQQVRPVAHAQPDGEFAFGKGPAVDIARACRLALGIKAQFAVDFFGLRIADQPQASKAECGQHQPG
jgi:hypothetical protein